MQAPAAAPADQAGAEAVGRAARERSMSDAMLLEEVVVTGSVNASKLDEMRRARAGINPTQRVGGRLFIMRDSTWTDLGHGDSLRVVTIAPYSDAYFALLKSEPDAVHSSPEEDIDAATRTKRVRAALDDLTPRDREALLLWDAGMSYGEIAAQTGLARGAIGTTLARARRRLVEAYDAGLEGGQHVARG